MRKFLTTFVAVLLLISVFSIPAFAKSYTTVLYMNQETPTYNGSTRDFDGPSIKMKMTLEVTKTVYSESYLAKS